MYNLPFWLHLKCEKWGKDYSAWLLARADRRTLSYRGIEHRPDRLADAKKAECIFAIHQGWLAAVNFNVERGPELGGDFIARWRLLVDPIDDYTHTEVRQTSMYGTLLIYPIRKWSKFEQRRHDLFALVKTAVDRDRNRDELLPQGFCRGWCTKQFFLDNHIICMRNRSCELRGEGIDKGTPYIEEHLLWPMDTFPVPQDYRLIDPAPWWSEHVFGSPAGHSRPTK
jgi:hypothetical protein